jgi:uncharacterized protein YdeI (YjbR/CyaY-like superfamily)
MTLPDATFFRTPADFRRWLTKHHATARELWVGYYKKESGRPSITWPQSVDEALCVGWIDGVRRRLDDESYAIRFSPRRKGSIWSTVNIKRAQELIAEGRMQPAGLTAWEARRENRSGIYAYEQRTPQLAPPYESLLRKNRRAWEFFQKQPPSYRKTAGWYVVSAKKEETRLKRLQKLITEWAEGRRER